jgi:integrating conjugative element protein (TIGR03759 family)
MDRLACFMCRDASMRARLLAGFAIALNAAATAQDSAHSIASQTPAVQTPYRATSDAQLDQQKPGDWGLTPAEWSRYRQLMRGPLGIYSPNLDPLSALGIEARSDQERRHFAELQAQMEARRAERLLAYQRAYDLAWKRLFPTLQPVVSGSSSAASDQHADSRAAVFVREDCMECERRVKELQASGRPFDLYMVGTRNEDSRIRAWATHVGIDPARVRSHSITLNHDSGRWVSLGLQGALPAVLRQVNGQWERE